MAYSTKIRLKRTKQGKSGKVYSSKSWQKVKRKELKKKWWRLHLGRYKRAFYIGCGVLVVILLVGAIYLFAKVQEIAEGLPSIDKPFAAKSVATEILDRNGNLLYRMYDGADRDMVTIKDVPFLVKAAFVASEDKNFYEHGGIDLLGMIRCGLRIVGNGDSCGASTIDQQLLKLTTLGNLDVYTRKVSEVIMAFKMEEKYTKDQILEMYLTVVPEGGDTYGVTRGAAVYFGKELKDLTIAEMAVLAAIPNNPNYLSPRSAEAIDRVKDRQMYVLQRMEDDLDMINQRYRTETGEDKDILTKEMIDAARTEELVYKDYNEKYAIEAPHFVFYAQKLLQERGYNNGVPFTYSELSTSGYKIYTTLDLDMQRIAEEQVTKGVEKYGVQFGAENAALMAMDPRTGEILAMVGSKDYFGKNIPEGCSGSSCKFSGKVNILDTLQGYGSSMKPIFYYLGYERGLLSPGSIMPDFPIQIGNYKPKNYEGGYNGLDSSRWMLRNSRNIPAIYLVNALGLDSVLDELEGTFGYSTFANRQNFGLAISIGGADVKLIEHAQALSVLASQGYFTQHEVITKIVNAEGEVIYEYKPEPQLVADPKAAFMVNDVLNGRKGGPGVTKMGRDVAGKTGTSDNETETLYVTYTPEIVVVGWLGNNDNSRLMKNGARANGNNSSKPWISEFYTRIEPTLKGDRFAIPAGVTTAGNCTADEGLTCPGATSDYVIAGKVPPNYMFAKSAVVCVDEPTKLARPIDIALGKSTTITVKAYTVLDTPLQPKLDEFLPGWVAGAMERNANSPWGPLMPTEYCTINRNPEGTNTPWVDVTSPVTDEVYTTTLPIKLAGYSPAGDIVSIKVTVGSVSKTYTTATVDDSLDISGLANGPLSVVIVVEDSVGGVYSKTISAVKATEDPTPTATPTTAPTTVAPTPTV